MPHIHEKIDLTVVAYIVHDQRVLMVLHKLVGRWVPIGGHVELDEDPEQALIREVQEESGLKVSDLEIAATKPDFISQGFKPLFAPTFLDIHDMPGNHQHIGMIYVLRSKSDQVVLEERAADEIRWLSVGNIEDPALNLMTGTQYYAKEAIKIAQNPATHWEPLV